MKIKYEFKGKLWQYPGPAGWFDTKVNTYLLPIKKEIRVKELLNIDESRDIILWI